MPSSLNNEINYWNNYILSISEPNNKLYELAFFKIFVKFELFLSNIFITYSIGTSSSAGYIADRKLEFKDEQHLKAILKSSNANFVNYAEKIPSISREIFAEEKDPFSLIFRDLNINNDYKRMTVVRNYIAHESAESKKKYKELFCLNSNFIEPGDWLLKKPRGNKKTNYTIFIDTIEKMRDILIDPSPYL